MKETRNKKHTFLDSFLFSHVFFYSLDLNFYLPIHNKNFISLVNWENTSLN